jgi:DnaJ-class molecular chaperone
LNPYDYFSEEGDFIDFYQCLGIPENAGSELIKQAYKAKCKYLHPDGKPDSEKKWFEEEFKKPTKLIRY